MDNDLISNEHGVVEGLITIGIRLNGNNSYGKVKNNIRLTQKGHDFAASLSNKEVLGKIMSELKESPFKAVFEGGQKLLEHIAKKKIDSLIAAD